MGSLMVIGVFGEAVFSSWRGGWCDEDQWRICGDDLLILLPVGDSIWGRAAAIAKNDFQKEATSETKSDIDTQ